MNKIKPSIDFEIIWKKIHAQLSSEENQLFEAWLIEDRRHLTYFKKAELFYKNGSEFDNQPVKTEVSWQKLQNKINQLEKRRREKRIAYIASAAASVIILISVFVLSPFSKQAELASLPQVIEPGSNKAMLILDDGSMYDLSKERELSIETGGTTIKSMGSSIEYVQQEAMPEVLKYNTLNVPRGGEFFLTLADGTKVWLNSGTTLKYPVQFSSTERAVELNGEAFFEVIRDESRPFHVLSGEQELEVLGTSFNISSYLDDDHISTTLVSGKVKVFLKSDPSVSQNITPSYQSVFNRQSNSFTQQRVDVDQYVAWKEGWFRFEDQNLSDMMKTIARWYDVKVIFENEDAREIKFTGSIKRYESFKQILTIIERTKEVKFEIKENSVIIN